MGRKAFGLSKKRECDIHHCKKKKKVSAYKGPQAASEIKHQRVQIPAS